MTLELSIYILNKYKPFYVKKVNKKYSQHLKNYE